MRKTITVTFGQVPPPPPPSSLIITEAEYDLILSLYRQYNAKVPAIKFIRQQYGLSLMEAKDLCDAIAAKGFRE